ncbi:MAG: hypothetical protein AAB697_01435 [Patescibacteria group bacterium]
MAAWNKRVLDRDELTRLYQEQGLSLAKIGKVYGCDAGVVLRNMQEYRIPTRDLSESTTKVPTTRVQLVQWYWKDKLSMFDIANRLGCTHSAIVYKFKRFGIRSRGHLGLTPPLKLTKETLEYLYNRRLSLDKIARIVHRSKGGIERRFVKYRLVPRGTPNRACKYKKSDFSENLEEKAYMIGFRLGDLNVYDKVNIIQIRCSSTHRAQIHLIRSLFSSYTTPFTFPNKAEEGKVEIVCLVNKTFGFLVPKKDEVPKWVLDEDRLFWNFFAGYADAEGSFTFKKPGREGKTHIGFFTIQSQDKGIICMLAERLENLGVNCYGPRISRRGGTVDKRGIRNNRDMWRFDVIKKKSLWLMLNKIENLARHSEKKTRIQRLKDNLMLRNHLPYSRPISLTL